MRRDITIPKVEGVYIAIINEHNDINKTQDWNAYIINDNDAALDVVLIVTSGYNKDKVTSTFRKKLIAFQQKAMPR